MHQEYMTRKDEHVGDGVFDSIKWLFETHICEPDTGEFNYAVLTGHNEDSLAKIELWRNEPMYNTPADRTWIAQ